MPANDCLLHRVGPWTVGQKTADGGTVERIELRTDGHGISGHYDVIYIYTAGDETPWMAIPAHQCDSWEYMR